ncbi:MAG: sugar ABC transporter substrate-binding protein [Caldilineaceae bacterium]
MRHSNSFRPSSFSLVIWFVLLALLFTACTPVNAPANESGAAAGPVEIRLASYGLGDAWNKSLEDTLAPFREQNPNIKVTIEFRPIDGYWDKLQTEYAGGQAPDITINQMNWVVPGAARGMFVDLKPFIDRDQIDMSAYFYPMEPEWGWKGGMYGGLLYAGGQALYINKDLLNAAGLDFPADDWTWTDMLEYARKLTDPATNQWGIHMSIPNPPYWGTSFIHGAGGSVLNDTYDKCTLTDEASQAGLQFMADLILKEQVMPSPSALAGQENPFLTGKVAIYFGGTWEEGSIREAGFDWDFAHMPVNPDTGIRRVQMGSNAWSVLSTSAHQEEAWQVVKFLMGEDGQRGMMKNGVPGLKSVVESQEYRDLHQPQHIDVLWGDFANYGHDYYPTPDTDEWWAAVGQELSAIWSGEVSVEEATTAACAAVDEIFARRPAEWAR